VTDGPVHFRYWTPSVPIWGNRKNIGQQSVAFLRISQRKARLPHNLLRVQSPTLRHGVECLDESVLKAARDREPMDFTAGGAYGDKAVCDQL
jgi:hypothetical protein